LLITFRAGSAHESQSGNPRGDGGKINDTDGKATQKRNQTGCLWGRQVGSGEKEKRGSKFRAGTVSR